MARWGASSIDSFMYFRLRLAYEAIEVGMRQRERKKKPLTKKERAEKKKKRKEKQAAKKLVP